MKNCDDSISADKQNTTKSVNILMSIHSIKVLHLVTEKCIVCVCMCVHWSTDLNLYFFYIYREKETLNISIKHVKFTIKMLTLTVFSTLLRSNLTLFSV